jgi:hypothetical protein
MVKKKDKKSKDELDQELEEALKETFPASDPPSITQPEGHAPPRDQKN